MKKLYLLLVVTISLLSTTFAQTNTVNTEKLKEKFAEYHGIKVTDIKSATVLTFGKESYAYVKYVKDGVPSTTAQGLELGGPDGGFNIIGGFTITCAGQGCSECDIEGLPNPANAYCDCKRKALENGYCNMTKSINGGGK
jgi:hypothetical protein